MSGFSVVFYFLVWVVKTLQKNSPLRGDFNKTSKETAFYTKIFNMLPFGPPQAKIFGVLARFLSIFDV